MPMMTGFSSRLLFELGLGHEVRRIVGAARGADHGDDLVVDELELIGRRLALKADQVFRLAHESALYGTPAPCRTTVYLTEGWTNRATSVPFSITDA